MLYDWLIRRRMPLTYVHWIADHVISWMPPCKVKDTCEHILERSVFFVKTANLKVVSNLGKCPNYSVLEIENFLPHNVCDRIVEAAKQKGVVDSTIIDDRGTRVLDLYTRKSKQTWLTDSDSLDVQRTSEWVSILTDLPRSHQEDMQVVAYPEGGYYNPHFDASFHPDVIPNMNRGCGPRLYTFLIYLNDDFEGGETDFPEIGVKIVPKKGKAILFQNIDASQDLIPESMHAGCPVKSGTKWIANKWVRIWPFELSTLSAQLPPICNKPVCFPKSLEMVRQNLIHYNSLTMPRNKQDQCDVILVPGLVSEPCELSEVLNQELTQYMQSVVPIPMAEKQCHITNLHLGDQEMKEGFGLRLATLYLFLSDGSVTFPYLNKSFLVTQGDALIVHRLDEMLLYNVAAMHTVNILPNQFMVKHVYTLPLGYKAYLDAPQEYRDRVKLLSEYKVALHNGKIE